MSATLRTMFLAAVLALGVAHPGHAQDTTTGRPAEARPTTTFERIDKALEAGTIDAETAHKYRVFAGFGDTRLPAAYRGEGGGRLALPPSVAEVGQLLATFSPATRAELAPFFMRPTEPGSWVTLSTIPGQEPSEGGTRPGGPEPGGAAPDAGLSGPFEPRPGLRDRPAGPAAAGQPVQVAWNSVSAVGGKAKVWWQGRYPGDAAIAQGLASALTSLIWGKLTGLMNQGPYPDNGIVNNGGDAAFDFYLVHSAATAGWVGQTTSSIAAEPCHAARYILVDTRRYGLGSATTYGALQIATHELMHAIMFAYRVRNGCPNPWISEASADWASNWVYPLTDAEHREAQIYLNSVQFKLDNILSTSGMDRFYGEHLLPYFVEKATGGTGFMPRMWTNFKTMDVLEGVDAVLPGRFEKFWPRFLVQLWNQPPVDAPDGFKQWDRLAAGVFPTGGVENVKITSGIETRKMNFLQENPPLFVFQTGVQPLAGHFRHFTFDRSVRSVVFRNTIREEGILHGTVWGIEKIGGTWQTPADWTEELQKAWCRDEPKEDIDELVLVFGNHDWKRFRVVNPAEEPTVEARPMGCSGWTGTTDVVNTITSSDPAVTIVETVHTTMLFEPDSSFMLPGQPREYWKVVSGHASWNVRVSGACTGGGQGGFAITDRGPGEEIATLRVWEEGGQLHHSGTNGPWPGDIPMYTITCPEGPSQMVLMAALGFFVTDFSKDLVAPDGKSFSGDHTSGSQLGPGISTRHRYTFRCTRNC